MFTVEDVQKALKGVNFKKALGSDWLDGRLLKDEVVGQGLQ